MKHLKSFENISDYNNSIKNAPMVSRIKETGEIIYDTVSTEMQTLNFRGTDCLVTIKEGAVILVDKKQLDAANPFAAQLVAGRTYNIIIVAIPDHKLTSALASTGAGNMTNIQQTLGYKEFDYVPIASTADINIITAVATKYHLRFEPVFVAGSTAKCQVLIQGTVETQVIPDINEEKLISEIFDYELLETAEYNLTLTPIDCTFTETVTTGGLSIPKQADGSYSTAGSPFMMIADKTIGCTVVDNAPPVQKYQLMVDLDNVDFPTGKVRVLVVETDNPDMKADQTAAWSITELTSNTLYDISITPVYPAGTTPDWDFSNITITSDTAISQPSTKTSTLIEWKSFSPTANISVSMKAATPLPRHYFRFQPTFTVGTTSQISVLINSVADDDTSAVIVDETKLASETFEYQLQEGKYNIKITPLDGCSFGEPWSGMDGWIINDDGSVYFATQLINHDRALGCTVIDAPVNP